MPSFYVLNADGLRVAEYDNLPHAKEAARDFAMSTALEDPSAFYSVHSRSDSEDLAVCYAKDCLPLPSERPSVRRHIR